MAIIPALDWLLARLRGDPMAPPAPPLLLLSAAEACVNAELPLQRRSASAALLGGGELRDRARPPLAALLRPTDCPGPQGPGPCRLQVHASAV